MLAHHLKSPARLDAASMVSPSAWLGRPKPLKTSPCFSTITLRSQRNPKHGKKLHARGGIDVTLSKFRLTLANTSSAPITITDIEAVVTASQPRPMGSEARVYTQGTEGLEEFGVLLRDTTSGSRFAFHHTPHGEMVEDAETGPPFFTNHDISLAPNAIYEAKVAVQIEVSREVEYGFVIRGNTAQHSFTYRPQAQFKIVGFNPHLLEVAHLYWQLPRASGSSCWIHAYAKYEPACP